MKKIKNEVKKEKVGSDGFTKKERRALKVQEKQSGQEDNKNLVSENKNTISPIDKRPPEQKQTPVDNKKIQVQDNKNQILSEQITEKELRKIEWEKKLVEQKLQDETKCIDGALSKAALKAKRRAQQEAQRLAKVSNKTDCVINNIVPILKEEKKNEVKNLVKKSPIKGNKVKNESHAHRVHIVQHLYVKDSVKPEYDTIILSEIHPVFVRLGVQYSHKTILGSNARCLALLAALKHLIDDLQTPSKQEFCRYLEAVLQTSTNYLQSCRPFAVSMINALRQFKLHLTQVDTNLKDNEKRAKLQEAIETYINDDIIKAGEAISLRVKEKIKNGDVILTYGCSSLIRKILVETHKDGKKFDVIVVDARPLLEGREMIRRLAVAGIKCTYILINAVNYVMGSVTKVVLGAHALLNNGYVMSRVGTAQIALVARAYNKPVLVCCEKYKFSERVQTDSFVYNEIGDPDKLSVSHIAQPLNPLCKWKEMSKLTPLNLHYDVTPPDLVTAVVTDLAILPCTSVPVVLRISANDNFISFNSAT